MNVDAYKDHIHNKLPKTVENQLHILDQSVRNFIFCLHRGDDVWKVVDEMFVYYSKALNNVHQQLEKMHLNCRSPLCGMDEETIQKLIEVNKNRKNYTTQ